VRVALDTNAYVAFARGEAWSVQAVRSADAIVMPVIVLAELRAGFLSGDQAKVNEQTLVRFLNSKRVSIAEINDETTHQFARLFAYLRRAGKPIPTHDLWIAAVTLQTEAILLTNDAHFNHLPQVARQGIEGT
jgi:tRNA(fMet)-specific endonuclease VapC